MVAIELLHCKHQQQILTTPVLCKPSHGREHFEQGRMKGKKSQAAIYRVKISFNVLTNYISSQIWLRKPIWPAFALSSVYIKNIYEQLTSLWNN